MTGDREKRPPTGFKRTRDKARSYINDPARLNDLLRRAREKADRKKDVLREVWDDLMALFRLLKAWVTGAYKGVAWQTMLLVTTAILYFVMPLDVVPDFIAMFGFLDDAAVIGYVVAAIRKELDRFLLWERADGADLPTDEPTVESIEGPTQEPTQELSEEPGAESDSLPPADLESSSSTFLQGQSRPRNKPEE